MLCTLHTCTQALLVPLHGASDTAGLPPLYASLHTGRSYTMKQNCALAGDGERVPSTSRMPTCRRVTLGGSSGSRRCSWPHCPQSNFKPHVWHSLKLHANGTSMSPVSSARTKGESQSSDGFFTPPARAENGPLPD